MENGDLYNGSSSFRRSGSSTCTTGSTEATSRTSREEEDEEALKWAALERLPTFRRLKKGLLSMREGRSTEIDIHNLGFKETKILIDRLLKVPEEDSEKVLSQIKKRIER
jgi:hypothetical protein